MKTPPFRVLPNGEQAITLRFLSPVSERLSRFIIRFAALLKTHLPEEHTDIIPAYQSLTIQCMTLNHRQLTERVTDLLATPLPESNDQPKPVEIPVCYDPVFARDMPTLEKATGLTRTEIINRHRKPDYLVHMLGFLPGFLYLGGMDPSLSCSRKSTPAINIPAGSVAIGGHQTGIYPVDSPGGWHIIGRTPLKLFSPKDSGSFIAAPLDRIRFVDISREAFDAYRQMTP